MTYIPIRPHIFRPANGVGGMSLNSLNNVLAITNRHFLNNGSGIQFYFCGTAPDYIDNDALFNEFPEGNETIVNGRDVTNALNTYFVHFFDRVNLLGYANFPDNNLESTRSYIRTGALSDGYIGNFVLNHELGHTFSLYHTHQGGTATQTPELVTRGVGANCSTAGDYLCDTPADPLGRTGATTAFLNGCQIYTGQITDANGAFYNPQMNNIMSYYEGCNTQFTGGQHNRIQDGLTARQSATAYSLACEPTNVPAVTNIGATSGVAAGVVLTWQDNATNEMGYLIERAFSVNGTFMPLGGAGTNATTFTDLSVGANTSYVYRVRPSNSTTGGISGVVSATAGRQYCRPTFSQGCSDGDGLNSFTLNGTLLSQNTGCATNCYDQFNRQTTQVSLGQAVTVGGHFINTVDGEGVTIWADFDRNGTFEATEQVYQTPDSVTGVFGATFSIPAATTPGPLLIRVAVQFRDAPGLPCGTYVFGETEDYLVNVVSCAMVSTRAGNWNDPTVWSCNRVPTIADLVEVRHALTIPTSTTGSARQVKYVGGGRVTMGAGGRLLMGN